MHMTWERLMFMHWRVPAEALRPRIPAPLELETFDGSAWIAVVPFEMRGTRPRYAPGVRQVSDFPELNVRTYVTANDRPGVWFFSLDAANRLAVRVARRFFKLPYMDAEMACQADGVGGVRYVSHRTHRGEPPADFAARYRPTGPAFSAQPGSLEYFLTARYCLYAGDAAGREDRGRVYRGEVDHADWPLQPAEAFEALPGMGLRARIDGRQVTVGSSRLVVAAAGQPETARLEAQGKTLLHVEQDGELLGTLAFSDSLRPEVPAALEALRQLGLNDLHLLTGDNRRTAAALAERLGLPFSAELLPQDKIEIVRRLQAEGKVVVMVGDGVNDAPALAQADVGIAMGAIGSDVALEAASIALMRDDWTQVPEALRMARRTMSVVRMNLGFTVVYNAVGLTLAALGFLPPVLAAAVQSIPDLGILANSSRLLRQGGAAHAEAN
jgi:uncharacterized protein YqjF (DUF2071 family)/soluble P-type ATPase